MKTLRPAPKRSTTASSLLPESDPSPGGTIQHRSTTGEQDHGLLIDKPAVRKAILRMVITLEENFHTREDLLQEALVYFWSIEGHHPGQAVYWYLQGAKFHLENLRKS